MKTQNRTESMSSDETSMMIMLKICIKLRNTSMSRFLIIYQQVEEAARGKSQQKRTNVDKGELSEMFGTIEKDPKPRREGSAPITREAVMKEDALDGDIDDDETDDDDTDDEVDETDMKNIM